MVAGLVLVGRATQQSSEDTLRQHGYSARYVTSYHDGCPSGKRAGGDHFQRDARDNAAYAAGGDYKTGWGYGFLTCRETEVNNERTASIIGAAVAGGMSSSHGADGVDARDALKGMDTSGLENVNWNAVQQ